MEAFVTGSSGVLGQSLLPQLAARGDRMRLFDMVPLADDVKNDAARRRPRRRRHRRASTLADMRDPRRRSRRHGGRRGGLPPRRRAAHEAAVRDLSEEEIYTMNLAGVQNVLDAARATGVRKVVFISSSGVYGLPRDRRWSTRTATPGCRSAPTAARSSRPRALCLRAVEKGLDVTMLRPMSLFGDGMTGVFVLLFDWVRRDRRVFLLGSGSEPRADGGGRRRRARRGARGVGEGRGRADRQHRLRPGRRAAACARRSRR